MRLFESNCQTFSIRSFIIILPPSSHETKDATVCVCLYLERLDIGIEKMHFTISDKKSMPSCRKYICMTAKGVGR